MIIINAFLLGLSTGIFCLAFCGPIYLPQLLAQRHRYQGWGIFFQFNLGRLFAYIIIGAIFGWLGAQTQAQWLNTYARWAMILLSILLILYGLGLSLPKLKLCAIARKSHFPLISGFLLGMNICPPFLLAIVYNFQAGGIINGMLFFLMFFLGTTIYLIPVTILGNFVKVNWLRQAGRLAAIAIGIIFLYQSFF